MTDAPITAPDALTALCELADMWDAVVRLRYRERRYYCSVMCGNACFAQSVGLTVAEVIEHALEQLQAAEDKYLATQDEDDECSSCYGSGGGPDPALRCTSCSGRGYR